MRPNLNQVLNKIKLNLILLDPDQLKFVQSLPGKLNNEDYTSIYTIYTIVNNKLIIKQARESNK